MRKDKAISGLASSSASSRFSAVAQAEAVRSVDQSAGSYEVAHTSAYFELRDQPIVTHDVIERLRMNVDRLSDLQARLRYSMVEISAQLRRL